MASRPPYAAFISAAQAATTMTWWYYVVPVLEVLAVQSGQCGPRNPLLTQDAPEEFHGQREHDGRVLLGGDGRERLQVAQLEGRAGLGDDVGSVLERTGRALLAFRRDHLFPHLGASFSGRLGFGRHGPLHLNRQANVLAEIRDIRKHTDRALGSIAYLHGMADGLSLGQDLGEVLCA
ncbi:unnamed protein product [Ixodes pacificus]